MTFDRMINGNLEMTIEDDSQESEDSEKNKPHEKSETLAPNQTSFNLAQVIKNLRDLKNKQEEEDQMQQLKLSISSNRINTTVVEPVKSPELYNKVVKAINKKDVDLRQVLLRNITFNVNIKKKKQFQSVTPKYP